MFKFYAKMRSRSQSWATRFICQFDLIWCMSPPFYLPYIILYLVGILFQIKNLEIIFEVFQESNYSASTNNHVNVATILKPDCQITLASFITIKQINWNFVNESKPIHLGPPKTKAYMTNGTGTVYTYSTITSEKYCNWKWS